MSKFEYLPMINIQRDIINKSRYVYLGMGPETSTPFKIMPLTISESPISSETQQIQADQDVEMVGILEPEIPLQER